MTEYTQQQFGQPGSLGIVEPQIAEFSNPLTLTSGDVLDSYHVVYETYGQLNADKSNALLVCHALSSNHHAAGYHTPSNRSAGWWNQLIGPGKPIDSDQFFIVCNNNIGGCAGSTGPNSENPKTGQPYGPQFPMVTVTDWVNTQVALADYLGIDKWAAVIGGSLGGMQALQWSINYPQRLAHAIIIASAAKLTAQNIGFNDVARQAIRTDPDFHGGNYYAHGVSPQRGLRIARMLGHMTYLSDDYMAQKFGRNLRQKKQIEYQYQAEFEVESYLRYQGEQFVKRFDANTYLLMTKALDYFDPAAEHDGDLAKALARVIADFLVISFDSDWRFAPERSREIVRALYRNKLNVSYAELQSPHGHDAFLLEDSHYFSILRSYLKQILAEKQK